ncbi:hypothetical protein LCGC14_2553360 [marine sediment metagenome]|uniref:ABC transmembrane type-2 domain-containing protein n=1 Tax=marine sediment metagenome TaxID=412755 RepID=A0A0F9DFD1_9ZZZZ
MTKVIIKLKRLFTIDFYKYNFSRIFTIAEKNVKIQLRFKFNLYSTIIFPFLPIIMSIIVLMRFFGEGVTFGQWNDTNYLVFLFTAFNIELLRNITQNFPKEMQQEKYWKTLPALMIAPFSKMHLLLGILLSHLIIISIPFIVFFLLTYLISPISPITIIFTIFIYLLIVLIFSGIGLFLAVFAISEENYWRFFTIGLQLLFYISCVTYPFELFPAVIQPIIRLNPFYHIFEILRFTWLEDNIILTITNYPFQFTILIGTAIIVPLLSIYVFKTIFDKFGIVGY